jgi:ankyrin repeat protein
MVDIEAKDKDGHSPLALAVAIGRDAIVKLLLENEAKDNPSRSLLAPDQGEQERLCIGSSNEKSPT